MTELMQQMSYLVATEGDGGFLMAADEFDDSADKSNQAFGQLLRRYVEIQTYVRMSQPIPLDMADNFKKLNDQFENTNRFMIEGVYGAGYNQPFGPFFLQLTCSQSLLASNLNWLERQPVRELDLLDMRPGEDLNMIFRNHRFQSLKRVTIRPDYRMRDVSGLAACMKQMVAPSMISLNFQWGIDDRLGLVKSAFQANKTIAKGCELFISKTRVHVKK